ncbi:hypothetical protein GJA_1186 [Janthinobacterium agaricidamnosum NBRC 102515 = DSM 9628]|uniref:Uncharacterized protein n=1 Tax=Janthinobacterium agaricidamnosum NBRC 102515 = DSM 9628 TaxID=1349767 RepID=W0UZ53_9BURK|nr:hypothetical protein GJA_1186 [Janthinobacterium agaricidamnosum NBRC 102515 = DSM 9628]
MPERLRLRRLAPELLLRQLQGPELRQRLSLVPKRLPMLERQRMLGLPPER